MKTFRLDLVCLLTVLVCAIVSLGPASGIAGWAYALDPELISGTRESGDLSPGHFDNGPVPGDEAADYIAEPAADRPQMASADIVFLPDSGDHDHGESPDDFRSPCMDPKTIATLEDDEDGGTVGWRASSLAEREEESEEPLTVNDEDDDEQADGPFNARAPDRLLTRDDQSLVRRLSAKCEELPEVRQEVLNDYLETLGLEGIGFAVRFEDITGIHVLDMADDPHGVAALLGAYRLARQGELTTDESIHAVRNVLAGCSPQWGEGVDAILAGEGFGEADAVVMSADPSEAAAEPAGLDLQGTISAWVFDALHGMAWRSLDGLRQVASSLADRLTEVDWLVLLTRAAARAGHKFARPDGNVW
jgi:hypothetical protein